MTNGTEIGALTSGAEAVDLGILLEIGALTNGTEIGALISGAEAGALISGAEAGDLGILLETLALVLFTERFGTLTDLNPANISFHFLHISAKSSWRSEDLS